MRNLPVILFLFVACSVTKPTPIPIPVPEPEVTDTIHHTVTIVDTFHAANTPVISIVDFGAKAVAGFDNYLPIQNAVDSAIKYHIAVVRFPVGIYGISHSILLSNNGQFFSITLLGDQPSKSAPTDYVSEISCNFKAGFGIGIQLGKGITIENLSVIGQYNFPSKVTNKNIGTLTFDQWSDSTITDSRYSPYAGICIDPFQNSSGSQGGTTGVEIRQCSVRGWMVGICLTPNAVTANDEMINMIDDDVEGCRVAIAIGQDQSKEIHIDRFRCWGSTYTILDGLTYGKGTGGGSVMIEGMNIAGNVNQLFNIVNDRFPLSAKDIYSESLFRIGTVGGSAGANIINAEIDFLSGPGWPEADYLINGSANFYGGSLRYYDQQATHRMNLVNTGSTFSYMTLSTPPITRGLYGIPQNVYPTPEFDHVHLYVSGKSLNDNNYDTLIQLQVFSNPVIDKVNWTATYTGSGIEKTGDYILGAGRGCYGWPLNSGCPTIQIGRVTAINGTTITLDCVGLNAIPPAGMDAVYIDRLK